VGDDIEVFSDESREHVAALFHMLRQQGDKGKDRSNLSLSDFIAPKESSLEDYIDWTPFFQAWEMKGRYPEILNDKKYGSEASKIFKDARNLLEKLVNDRLLKAQGIIGIFPANSVGDDIEVFSDESREHVAALFHMLRQQGDKGKDRSNLSLSDFIAPKESSLEDYIGVFALTTGIGSHEEVAKFEADHDDYNGILLQSLADRLAEAFAELLHCRVRKEF